MPILKFPNPRLTSQDGIVGFGGDLAPESLLLAYKQGIFPWPMEGLPLPWFCPPERAILAFKNIHVPRSLEKARKRSPLRYSIDQAFQQVIQACASTKRPGQRGTWITHEMLGAYVNLHQLGHAHSVEVWRDDHLVGGIYGVDAGGAFAGESMFHREPNASKLALLHLCEYLMSRGLDWMDIQMLTPHMEALGAQEISRNEFLDKLAKTQERRLQLF
jgi:leucyl/phenylalanyl-tRNA--protein transferase